MGTPPSGGLNQRVVENVAILDISGAISRKRCKIGGKLLSITNRKSHMGFRLVPNSVTLRIAQKWLKIHFLRHKCRPNNVVFNDSSFMAILAGNRPKR